jgi:GNAT superfamily N-acetyltransferase
VVTAPGATSDEAIRVADRGDLDAVGEVMALAMTDDPVTRWLIDDDETDKRRIMPRYFAMLAELSIEDGLVQVLGDFAAVAVWLDATTVTPAPPPEPAAELVALCGRHTSRFHAIDHANYQGQVSLPPHHHLFFLATRPQFRRQGLGSQLLAAHHRTLDQAGTPACLDASNLLSRRLYLRRGYVDLHAGAIPLPDGPSMWPMWRAPGGGGPPPC